MLLKTHNFRFDKFLLDTQEKVLFCEEEIIPITPKVYDLLYLLIRNHGHIVEKDEIMKEVWADSFVEDSNLTYTIRQLRILLDDNARDPRYIETVPRRGYRFIAEVCDSNGNSAHPARLHQRSEPATDLLNTFSGKTSFAHLSIQKNLFFGSTIFLLVIAVAFFMNSWVGKKEDITKNLSFKPLKTNGKLLHAVISPDGKYFAFTDETDEKLSLWLQNIETSEKRQILPAEDVFYFGLAFSNDGRSLYFVRRRQIGTYNADIYRISPLGKLPEKIIKTAEGWIGISPDDRKISFVRRENGGHHSLYIADSDGKNEQKLISRKSPERIAANKFSPDGKSIVFAAGQSNDGSQNFRLYKFDLINKQETVFSNRSFFVINDLAWLPDGQNVLISANPAYGESHKLWRVSGKTGEVEKLTADAAKYNGLSLDKFAKKLLALQLKNNFEVSVFSIADLTAKKILAPAKSAKFISNDEVVYSTDEGDLWQTNFKMRKRSQLTTGDFDHHYALNSPDGRFIYLVSNRTGSNQIWRINSDGTNPTQITKQIGGFPIYISPDGKKLFFESTLFRTIWQVPTDGKQREREFWDRKLLFASISADGKNIAFLRHDESRERQLDIEIYNFVDKTLIQKIHLAEKGLKPVRLAWLDDGATLLYITGNESGHKLWKQKINADSPQMIGDLGKDRIRDFSVSPNGEHILIISGEWLQDVILIEGLN